MVDMTRFHDEITVCAEQIVDEVEFVVTFLSFGPAGAGDAVGDSYVSSTCAPSGVVHRQTVFVYSNNSNRQKESDIAFGFITVC